MNMIDSFLEKIAIDVSVLVVAMTIQLKYNDM